MAESLFLVALHQGHFNKNYLSNSAGDIGYENTEIDALTLADHVSSGLAWVGAHLRNGHRKSENYLRSNLIVLDIDGDLTLEEFWANDYCRQYCIFTYTSSSHLQANAHNPEGKESYRAIFQLPETITRHELHAAAYERLLAQAGLSVRDTHGAGAYGLWFGNSDTQITWSGTMTTLPTSILDEASDVVEEAQARRARPAVHTADDLTLARRVVFAFDQVLRPSSDGEFHTYWGKLIALASATNDPAIHAAFLDWHSRGHHAHTQKRVEKRLLAARTGASPEQAMQSIINLAREQSPGWEELLPEDLRPGRERPRRRSLLSAVAPDLMGTGAPSSFVSGEASTDPQAPPEPPQPATPHPADVLRQQMEDARHEQRQEQQQRVDAGVPQLDDLFDYLYEVRIHRTYQGRKLIDTEASTRELELESDLMTLSPALNRNPKRIEQKLLELFRSRHAIELPTSENMQPRSLWDYPDEEQNELIPGLLLQGGCYLLHGKPGAGKTTLILSLVRSAVATPGHTDFLGYEVDQADWGTRRALVIASDGGENAISDLKRYCRWQQMSHAAWNRRYMDVIGSSAGLKSTAWQFNLYHLAALVSWLDEAAAKKRPYSILVIDSLKSILPPGYVVGDQAIIDYLKLIASICRTRNVTLLLVHHTAKDGTRPQGIAALEEITSGNFRLHVDENGHRIFEIEKTRAEMSGPRSIPFTLNDGALDTDVPVEAQQRPDDGRDRLLRFLQLHQENWIAEGGSPLLYTGISLRQLPDALRETGARHPAWKSDNAIRTLATRLRDQGILKMKGHTTNQGLVIAELDPLASDPADAFVNFIDPDDPGPQP